MTLSATVTGPVRIDRAAGHVPAPPEAVFAAWTDAATLARWLPPAGMTGRTLAFDPRPGGRFRLTLAYADATIEGKAGDGTDVVEGRFLVLDPPRHLAFASRFVSPDPAFAGEMRMDWTFAAEGSGTHVAIAATGVPPGIRPEDHAAGMAASLAQLAALFAPPPSRTSR